MAQAATLTIAQAFNLAFQVQHKQDEDQDGNFDHSQDNDGNKLINHNQDDDGSFYHNQDEDKCPMISLRQIIVK